jgi:hypothetical protein
MLEPRARVELATCRLRSERFHSISFVLNAQCLALFVHFRANSGSDLAFNVLLTQTAGMATDSTPIRPKRGSVSLGLGTSRLLE